MRRIQWNQNRSRAMQKCKSKNKSMDSGSAMSKTQGHFAHLTNTPRLVLVSITAFTSWRTNLSPFTKGCRERDASMWLIEFLWERFVPKLTQQNNEVSQTHFKRAVQMKSRCSKFAAPVNSNYGLEIFHFFLANEYLTSLFGKITLVKAVLQTYLAGVGRRSSSSLS